MEGVLDNGNIKVHTSNINPMHYQIEVENGHLRTRPTIQAQIKNLTKNDVITPEVEAK